MSFVSNLKCGNTVGESNIGVSGSQRALRPLDWSGLTFNAQLPDAHSLRPVSSRTV